MAVTPVIPQTITVHLGRPNTPSPNVTVPFTEYIKKSKRPAITGSAPSFTKKSSKLLLARGENFT